MVTHAAAATRKGKPATTAPTGSSALGVGPARCPACMASLAHLSPTTPAAREVAAVVARMTLAAQEATSRRVAQELGWRLDQASKALARAERDYLVRASRRALPGGGRAAVYTPRPGLVAYLQDEPLAREVAALLASPAALARALFAR